MTAQSSLRSGAVSLAAGAAFLALIMLTAFPGRSQPPEARATLSWRVERIIVTGASLPKLKGLPIERLRLMAFQNGKATVIPFQIDERDAKNQYILPSPHGKAPADTDSGKLDDNDELVFMTSDAGGQGKVEGANACQEIDLLNPGDGSRAYVYLVDFSGAPPPLSTVDYVTYKQTPNREEVLTPSYMQGFNDQHVFYDDLTILPAAGGNGRNMIDRLKMRSEVRAANGKINIKRTESDFHSTVTGLKDGPVRVIRRNETRMTLVAGMKSPAIMVDGTFYRDSFEVPSLFSLPFRMDLIATGASYYQGIDLVKEAAGMKYYSNLTHEPLVLDGRMTPQEEAMAKNPATFTWAMLTGTPGTWAFSGRFAPNVPLRVGAFYRDDASIADPPESDPGLMMFGFRFENLLKMKGETYAFNLVNYIIPNYNGNLNEVISLMEKPIQVTVR